MIFTFGSNGMSHYLFIDGGFLESMISKSAKFFEIDLSSMQFYYGDICRDYPRTFYYDALPSQKDGETDELFKAKLDAKLKLFQRINRMPNMHTREGITRNRSTRRMLEQKGVDILLAIDVFKHASSNNLSRAHVMTTDLDFFPLFEALRDTPVSVHLHCYVPETSEELMSLADVVIPITPFTILRWLRHPDAEKFIERNLSAADYGTRMNIKEGSVDNLPFYIFEVPHPSLANRYFGQSMAINPGQLTSAARWEYVVADFEANFKKRIFFD